MNEEVKIKKELVEEIFNFLIKTQAKDKNDEELKLRLQHELLKLA